MRVFPTRLYFFQGHDVDIERRTVSGGESISGEEDLIVTDGGGRWYASFTDADLDEPEIALAWRAWSALCDDGATPIIVPLTDARNQMMGEVTTPIGGLPWWNDTDFGAADNRAALSASAPLRATQLAISYSALPGPIRAGQRCSIDHQTKRHRAYRVVEVFSDNGLTAVVSIRPPLREAAASGTPINFVDPKCVMRVDGSMPSPLTLGYPEGSVRFVEDFSESYL